MSKLWLSLGLIHLVAAVGVFVDQVVRYSIWWEWDELYHHETFVGLLFYAAVVFFIVTVVSRSRRAS